MTTLFSRQRRRAQADSGAFPAFPDDNAWQFGLTPCEGDEQHRPRHPPVHRGGRAGRSGDRGVRLLNSYLRNPGLARAHSGDVTASSPGPGRGATFVLTLPLRATVPAASE